jgi:hypothetical protein
MLFGESKLNAYFNASCFTSSPVVGADGIERRLGTARQGSWSGRASEPGSRAFKNSDGQLAAREE